MNKTNKKCTWKDCAVRIGFELFYQGEVGEDKARKNILPKLEAFFALGNNVKEAINEVKNE